MDLLLVIDALQLGVFLLVPVLAGALVGALVAGVFKVATQIEDPSFGFAGRLLGASLIIYLAAEYGLGHLSQFAGRVWGGAEFYF